MGGGMGEGGLTFLNFVSVRTIKGSSSPFKLKRDVLIGLNTLLGWRRDLFIIGGVGGFFLFYFLHY
jgi:hypothetical protein